MSTVIVIHETGEGRSDFDTGPEFKATYLTTGAGAAWANGLEGDSDDGPIGAVENLIEVIAQAEVRQVEINGLDVADIPMSPSDRDQLVEGSRSGVGEGPGAIPDEAPSIPPGEYVIPTSAPEDPKHVDEVLDHIAHLTDEQIKTIYRRMGEWRTP